MPITTEQRRDRKNHIGSSDAAAILGRDPWRSRSDVYAEKTLNLADLDPTEAMQNGNRLEGAIIDFACERLAVTCERNVSVVSTGRDGGIMAANMDAIIDPTQAIEAKFVGPTNADDWGDDGSDAVPSHVALQCQHQMAVCGPAMTRVWVPAFIAISFRPEWRLLCVPRNQDIIDVLTDEEVTFWRDHVLTLTPPSDDPPTLTLLKRVIRVPDSTINLGFEAVSAWEAREAAAAVKKDAENAYEAASARVLTLLAENECGTLPDGRRLTYTEEGAGNKPDSDRLKIECPEVYAQYFHPSTRRVLRMRKAGK